MVGFSVGGGGRQTEQQSDRQTDRQQRLYEGLEQLKQNIGDTRLIRIYASRRGPGAGWLQVTHLHYTTKQSHIYHGGGVAAPQGGLCEVRLEQRWRDSFSWLADFTEAPEHLG